MLKSRLRNIIQLSNKLSNQLVGEPYDNFVKSLPPELDYYKDGGKYRLKAAWKAYGEPKNYQEALWNGLVETIGNKFSMPSIGYNSEKDSYEYLNTGKENDIVAKDIRVWDNDVIPFVKELKLGGYVRTFDEELNCWTYSKNQLLTLNQEGTEVIEQFLKGGKPSYNIWKSQIDFDINDDYDLESAYNDPEISFELLENWRKSKGLSHLSSKYKKPNHMTYSDPGYGWSGSDKEGWTFRPSPRQMQEHSFEDYLKYWEKAEPTSKLDYAGKIYFNAPTMFKQGGLMNLIPEGALHARKNGMELAELGKVTHKGIPVVDNKDTLLAEIEVNELILNLTTTLKVEKYYKLYNEEESQSKKDEIAIKCGQILAKSIIEDTDDRTNLILEVELKM